MSLQFLPLPPSELRIYTKMVFAAFANTTIPMKFPNGAEEEDFDWFVASRLRSEQRYPGRAIFHKVVDPELPSDDPFNQIVGVSQWQIFPHDRTPEELAHEDAEVEADMEQYGLPPNMVGHSYLEIVSLMSNYKKKHLAGRPFVYLQLLATRPGHARRGAGSMAMKFGCDRADELGLPAYIEGTVEGRGLYEKWGFEVVDSLPFDAVKFGAKEEMEHVCMLRQPKTSRVNGSS